MSKNYKYADIPWSELYDTAFIELIHILCVAWLVLFILTFTIPILIVLRIKYLIYLGYSSLTRLIKIWLFSGASNAS